MDQNLAPAPAGLGPFLWAGWIERVVKNETTDRPKSPAFCNFVIIFSSERRPAETYLRYHTS